MNAKLKKLLNRIEADTVRVENEIAELPNYGGDCRCDEREAQFQRIHNGNHFDEILTYCCDCGGAIVDL